MNESDFFNMSDEKRSELLPYPSLKLPSSSRTEGHIWRTEREEKFLRLMQWWETSCRCAEEDNEYCWYCRREKAADEIAFWVENVRLEDAGILEYADDKDIYICYKHCVEREERNLNPSRVANNRNRLMELLDEEQDVERIQKAECYRQKGEFECAIDLLTTRPVREQLRKWSDKIVELASDGETRAKEVQEFLFYDESRLADELEQQYETRLYNLHVKAFKILLDPVEGPKLRDEVLATLDRWEKDRPSMTHHIELWHDLLARPIDEMRVWILPESGDEEDERTGRVLRGGSPFTFLVNMWGPL